MASVQPTAQSPLVVEVRGLKELQEKLEKFHDEWQPIASRALMPGLIVFENEVKRNARADLGEARASVGSKVERTAGSEIIGKTGSNKAHAPYALEYGRRPGAMPPPDRLEEWAGRHGMAGAGFAIARAIAARGVSAPRTMSKAVAAKTGEAVKKFEEGIARELRRLGLKD